MEQRRHWVHEDEQGGRGQEEVGGEEAEGEGHHLGGERGEVGEEWRSWPGAEVRGERDRRRRGEGGREGSQREVEGVGLQSQRGVEEEGQGAGPGWGGSQTEGRTWEGLAEGG